MTELSVAAVQMAMVDDIDVNIAAAERLVREAAGLLLSVYERAGQLLFNIVVTLYRQSEPPSR